MDCEIFVDDVFLLIFGFNSLSFLRRQESRNAV